jgi:hypothetical protein
LYNFFTEIILFLLSLLLFSATMSAGKAQDMPPAGGYAKINFARVPAKAVFTGVQLFAGWAGKRNNSTLISQLIHTHPFQQ